MDTTTEPPTPQPDADERWPCEPVDPSLSSIWSVPQDHPVPEDQL
jgi:hypothetical protein